jgi:hypothetical protein
MPIVDPGWCWARSPSAPTAAFAQHGGHAGPQRRPREAAREVVTVDMVTVDPLSAGRMVLAVGLGNPSEADYAAFGQPDARGSWLKFSRTCSPICGRASGSPQRPALARRPGHLRGRRRGRASRSGWPAPGPTAAVAARRRWDGVVAAWPSPQGPGSAWSPTKWRSWPKSAVAGPPPGRSTGRGQPRPADAPSVAADTAGRPGTSWPAGWRSCAGPSGPARPPR